MRIIFGGDLYFWLFILFVFAVEVRSLVMFLSMRIQFFLFTECWSHVSCYPNLSGVWSAVWVRVLGKPLSNSLLMSIGVSEVVPVQLELSKVSKPRSRLTI